MEFYIFLVTRLLCLTSASVIIYNYYIQEVHTSLFESTGMNKFSKRVKETKTSGKLRTWSVSKKIKTWRVPVGQIEKMVIKKKRLTNNYTRSLQRIINACWAIRKSA